MKKFRIAVNGVTYDLEVTELSGETPSPAAVSVPAGTNGPAAHHIPAPEPAPKAAPSAGTTSVTAPMNGLIVSVNFKPGDPVAADDVVVVLEAMKMENEVFAGTAGTIKSIAVKSGDSVQPGDVLFELG